MNIIKRKKRIKMAVIGSRYSKLNIAIENIKTGVIFAQDKEFDNKIIKEFIVLKNYKHIKETFKQDGYNYYEVYLETKKCNYIQDLDIQDTDGLKNPELRMEKIRDTTIECLTEYLSLQNINSEIECIVLESPKTETKASYHLIYRVKDYYFQNLHIGCKNFYDWMIKEKKVVLLGVDSIYTKNRCLRILNSSKIQYPENKLHTDFKGNPLLTLGTYIEDKPTDNIIQTLTIKKPKKTEKIIELQTTNIDIIDELYSCLKQERAEDYHLWNNLGILTWCITDGSEVGKSKWDIFSQKSDKYDKEIIDRYWDNYRDLDKKMTIGSLYYYAKEDNYELFEKIRMKSYNDTAFLDGTTQNVAKLFYSRFSDKYIFNNESWYIYNSHTGIWYEQHKDYDVKRDLALLADEIQKTKKQIKQDMSQDEIDQIELQNDMKNNIITKLHDSVYKNKIIQELIWMMNVKETDFNNNKNIFAFSNGVWDFKEKRFRVGRFEEYITITTGYNYMYCHSKEANDFMKDLIPETEVREYLLRVIYWSLTPIHRREEFFIFYNLLGNNGKSTFLNLLYTLLGSKLYVSCNPKVLLENKDSADSATSSLISMKDKLIITFNEPEKSRILSSSEIKRKTGGDMIAGRELYKNQQQFKITGMLIMSCNGIPEMSSQDGGTRRRIRCINFKTEFVEVCIKPHHRQIRDLDLNQLKYSMFQLLLEHTEPIKAGLNYCPKTIRDTTERYFLDQDRTKSFVADYIEACPEGILKRVEINELFRNRVISREYQFYKMKSVKELHKSIEVILGKEFKDRKNINGLYYKGIIQGYKIKSVENECEIEE